MFPQYRDDVGKLIDDLKKVKGSKNPTNISNFIKNFNLTKFSPIRMVENLKSELPKIDKIKKMFRGETNTEFNVLAAQLEDKLQEAEIAQIRLLETLNFLKKLGSVKALMALIRIIDSGQGTIQVKDAESRKRIAQIELKQLEEQTHAQQAHADQVQAQRVQAPAAGIRPVIPAAQTTAFEAILKKLSNLHFSVTYEKRKILEVLTVAAEIEFLLTMVGIKPEQIMEVKQAIETFAGSAAAIAEEVTKEIIKITLEAIKQAETELSMSNIPEKKTLEEELEQSKKALKILEEGALLETREVSGGMVVRSDAEINAAQTAIIQAAQDVARLRSQISETIVRADEAAWQLVEAVGKASEKRNEAAVLQETSILEEQNLATSLAKVQETLKMQTTGSSQSARETPAPPMLPQLAGLREQQRFGDQEQREHEQEQDQNEEEEEGKRHRKRRRSRSQSSEK
jgi:hypothetical protein